MRFISQLENRMDPKSLRYTATHEWAALDGDICTVGITKFAADQLSDLTYIDLPKVGRQVALGASIGVIETTKSANDLYAPVAAEIAAVNDRLSAENDLLKNDPLGAGWMVKLKLVPGAKLDHLMDLAAYEKHCAAEAH